MISPSGQFQTRRRLIFKSLSLDLGFSINLTSHSETFKMSPHPEPNSPHMLSSVLFIDSGTVYIGENVNDSKSNLSMKLEMALTQSI